MSETAKIAEFAAAISIDTLPHEVADRVKVLVMDTVGIAIRAQHDAESTVALMAASRALGYAGGNSRVFGTSETFAPPAAAMINGTLAHSLDFDDTHASASIHSSAPIVPAALAAAEMDGADGKTVIAAIAAGFEVHIRLSLALDPSAHYKRGYHPSATCGAFGAAVAASVVFGLGAEAVERAIGIAGCQTSGSMRFLFDGAWTKRFQVGYAAHNGLLAASLAREGFVGPAGTVEGKDGFLQSYAPDPDFAKAIDGLGNLWQTMNVGVKPYPSCRYSHAAMGALATLRKTHDIRIEDVEAVEVGLPHTGWRIIGETDDIKRNPTGPVDGQFSMPFCGAVILRQGTMGWDDYARHLSDEDTLALTRKFSTVTDPWAEAEYPANMSGIVRVKTAGGLFEEKMAVPKGEPDNFMMATEFREKFDGLVSPYLDDAQRDTLVDAVLGLEQASAIPPVLALTAPVSQDLRLAGED